MGLTLPARNTKKFKLLEFIASRDGVKHSEIERFICTMNGYDYDERVVVRRYVKGQIVNRTVRKHAGIWGTNLYYGESAIMHSFCTKGTDKKWRLKPLVQEMFDNMKGMASPAKTVNKEFQLFTPGQEVYFLRSEDAGIVVEDFGALPGGTAISSVAVKWKSTGNIVPVARQSIYSPLQPVTATPPDAVKEMMEALSNLQLVKNVVIEAKQNYDRAVKLHNEARASITQLIDKITKGLS